MKEKNKDGFLFSVIIPAYNAADTIEEATLSVAGQKCGGTVQVIMVNDGSTDQTAEVMQRLCVQIPNAECYMQENKGVSAARNLGLSHAKGEYVCFLDADDKWGDGAFLAAETFLSMYSCVPFVAFPIEYFGARSGMNHPLNGKFKHEHTIHIITSPYELQMHAASCIFRRSDIGQIRFSYGLKYGEDSLFLGKILLIHKTYGVLNSAHYLYRKRKDGTSALDGCNYDADYYLPTLKRFHFRLLADMQHEFSLGGATCRYIENEIMYDLQWRIKKELPYGVLSTEEKAEYIWRICDLMSHIRTDIVLRQSHMGEEYKALALSMKYGIDVLKRCIQGGSYLYYGGDRVFSLRNPNRFKVCYLNIEDNQLVLDCLADYPIARQDYEIIAYTREPMDFAAYDNMIRPKFVKEYPVKAKYGICRAFPLPLYMKFCIPLQEGQDKILTGFRIAYRNGEYTDILPGFGDTCRLNTAFSSGFLETNGWIVGRKGDEFFIQKKKTVLLFKKEMKYSFSLLRHGAWKVAAMRFLLPFIRPFLLGNWIVCDRKDAAGDNGEAFFSYLMERRFKNARFAISKSSHDYNRLKKKWGRKVVDMDGIWYKFLFLSASKVISSQAGDDVCSPFGRGKRFVKDLFRHDFAFLQHGIIKDDLSGWLNYLSKDISLFVTSTYKEAQSIQFGGYMYPAGTVRITGLARHDALYADDGRLHEKQCKERKKIAVLPTWRRHICDMGLSDQQFHKTEFFQNYHAFLHNEKLIRFLEDNEITLLFALHPLMAGYAKHFDAGGYIEVSGETDYGAIVQECDMVLTDYSSLFFDFAIQRKPVVYMQFDAEDFFTGHSYQKGYFDYAKDGFGDLCSAPEEAVDSIIKTAEGGFLMDEKYLQRVDEFFLSHIGSNCERIYHALLSTGKNRKDIR